MDGYVVVVCGEFRGGHRAQMNLFHYYDAANLDCLRYFWNLLNEEYFWRQPTQLIGQLELIRRGLGGCLIQVV